jgi:hypothetical protein
MALVVLALFSCNESVGNSNDVVRVDASIDHGTADEDMGRDAGGPSRDGATVSTDGAAASTDGAASSSDRAESKDASRDRITEEEWERITGLVAGTHNVDSFPSGGCPTHSIEQEFRILPTVVCAWSATRDFRECDVERHCQRHTDCTERPLGRCRGSPSATCVYPDVPPSSCSSNSECTSLPGGSCPMVTEPNTPRCYPTGRCETPERRCFHQSELCSNDSECTSTPGGICEKRIRFARCEYQGCLEDGDCAAGQRCACSSPRHLCVPADCAGDADCSAGEQCLLERGGCFGAASGYHCTTPLDTCHAKEECASAGDCIFDGHWQCRYKPCPPPP